jgi:S1-C subfamily serine protease
MGHFGLRYEEPASKRNLPQPDQRDHSPHRRTTFSGTGFCVNAEGYFVTNHHVIENALEIRARSPTEDYPLRHVFSDPSNDLALLKGTESCSRVAVFRSGAQAQPGESVVVIGYPLNGLLGSSPQVTTGNVSSLIGIGDDTRGLQFTAPVQRGNSGGPLLDADGAVVGVVSAKLDVARIHALTGDIPQNVNFAIKSAVVRSFLEAIGVGYVSRPTGSPRQPSEIAAEAQRFVFRIDCSA